MRGIARRNLELRMVERDGGGGGGKKERRESLYLH